MVQDNSQQAGFNMAVASLIRVDSVLKIIQISAISQDFEDWRDALMQLRREICPYIKEKELEKITESLKELKKLKWIKIDEQGRKVYVEDKIEEAEELLDSITILCQKAMFSAGILMAIKDNESSGGFD